MKTINRYIGEVKPFSIRVRSKKTGKLIDITDFTIAISVKASLTDTNDEAKFLDEDVPHIIEVSGLARTADVTFDWDEGQYLVQMRVTDGAGQVIMSEIANLVLSKSAFLPAS